MAQVITTSIPGLAVEFIKSGSNLWAKVTQTHTGCMIRRSGNPLPYGKREFVKRLDSSIYNTVDWTQTFDYHDSDKASEILSIVSKGNSEILA